MIETPPDKGSLSKNCMWKQEISETQQTLQLDVDIDMEISDQFTSKLVNFEVNIFISTIRSKLMRKYIELSKFILIG